MSSCVFLYNWICLLIILSTVVMKIKRGYSRSLRRISSLSYSDLSSHFVFCRWTAKKCCYSPRASVGSIGETGDHILSSHQSAAIWSITCQPHLSGYHLIGSSITCNCMLCLRTVVHELSTKSPPRYDRERQNLLLLAVLFRKEMRWWISGAFEDNRDDVHRYRCRCLQPKPTVSFPCS